MLVWAKELRAKWEAEPRPKPLIEWGASGQERKDPRSDWLKLHSGPPKTGILFILYHVMFRALPVLLLSGDFPDRFVEVGIAEANMVSVGAGYAKAGYIPIVDTFGQFGVTKGNLPLTMAALSQAPVIAIFSHVGFQDAADGASHQATTYFAAVSAIPHTVAIAPSCAGEADALMYEAIKRYAEDRKAGRDGENYIFFVGRENYPIHWIEGAEYPWGKAQVIREGSDVVLVGCGPLLSKAVQAGELLAEKGVNATVIE